MTILKSPHRVPLSVLFCSTMVASTLPLLVILLNPDDLHGADFIALMITCAVLQTFFELPSGYLADRFGRWTTLFLGIISNLLAALLIIKNDPTSLMTAMFLVIASTSLFTGSSSAYLYDACERRRILPYYSLYESYHQTLILLSWIIVFAAIGPLKLTTHALLYAFLIPNILAALIVAMLPRYEPSSHQLKKRLSGLYTSATGYWYVLHEAFEKILQSQPLSIVVLGISIVFGLNSTLTQLSYSSAEQDLLMSILSPLWQFHDSHHGIAFRHIMSVLTAIGCLISPLFFRRHTLDRLFHATLFLLCLYAVLIVMSLFVHDPLRTASLSLSVHSISFLTIGTLMPASIISINANANSELRATTISYHFFIKYLVFAFLIQSYDLTANFHGLLARLGMLVLVIGIFLWLNLLYNHFTQPSDKQPAP